VQEAILLQLGANISRVENIKQMAQNLSLWRLWFTK